jgi:predicted amidohydrolase
MDSTTLFRRSFCLVALATIAVVALGSIVHGAPAISGNAKLKVAIVQMAFAPTLEGNREKIVAGIGDAKRRGARVAVFPEGALNARAGDSASAVDAALEAIRRTAKQHGIYVVLGGVNHSAALKKMVNWMRVIGPDGGDVFHYDKLFNNPRGKMPGVFRIDGVPCSGMICADRWLRGVEEIPVQQGARVTFELSNNYACEWVEPFGWYWNVPRALRNNVWVVMANTGNSVAGQPDESPEGVQLRHGHSAVIAPDGRLVARSDETATIVMAEIDPAQATAAAARARATHPLLRQFWEAGIKIQQGENLFAPPLERLESPETDITIAVAQMAGDVDKMVAAVGEARARKADVVVFPARATAASALERLQAAALDHAITVVFGAERRAADGRRNSAFVLGPDGALLTRYDQLSASAPYQPGTDGRAMWFRVKGVPAFVTIGQDALWTELSELGAVVGAQLHVHLDDERDGSPDATLRRRQVWSNMASYLMFTAVANTIDSTIWDDLTGMLESRHIVRGTPKPEYGPVEVDSSFSANLVVSATPQRPLIVATRRVAKFNPHFQRRPASLNPQMEPWYRIGAALLAPK